MEDPVWYDSRLTCLNHLLCCARNGGVLLGEELTIDIPYTSKNPGVPLTSHSQSVSLGVGLRLGKGVRLIRDGSYRPKR